MLCRVQRVCRRQRRAVASRRRHCRRAAPKRRRCLRLQHIAIAASPVSRRRRLRQSGRGGRRRREAIDGSHGDAALATVPASSVGGRVRHSAGTCDAALPERYLLECGERSPCSLLPGPCYSPAMFELQLAVVRAAAARQVAPTAHVVHASTTTVPQSTPTTMQVHSSDAVRLGTRLPTHACCS